MAFTWNRQIFFEGKTNIAIYIWQIWQKFLVAKQIDCLSFQIDITSIKSIVEETKDILSEETQNKHLQITHHVHVSVNNIL